MPDREPTEVTNLDTFNYGLAPLEWSRPRAILIAGPEQPGTPMFLSTVRPDGRPHSAGIGAVWYDGDLYFTSAPGTAKSKQRAANPACAISLGLAGIDVVVEGTASIVREQALGEAVLARFRAGGWPAEFRDGQVTAPFSAPSAGPPPWDLYRFVFDVAYGVASVEPFGATRWRFTG
jgi:hypothetical protein